MSKLEHADLLTMTKSFRGKMPHTSIALTRTGRDAIRGHWKRLEQLRRAASAWRPAEELGS